MMGTKENNQNNRPGTTGLAGAGLSMGRQVTYGSPTVNKIYSQKQVQQRPVSILKHETPGATPSSDGGARRGQARHVSTFFLGGDTSSNSTRNLARSLTKSAETLKLQQNRSNARVIPTLDVLRQCKFLFVRCVNEDQKFLTGSVHSYEIMDSRGTKLFYTKEMEGMGRKNSIGALTNKIFCLLALDGTELIRMEGGSFSAGKISSSKTMGEFLSCFRGTIFIGDIIEKVQRCPSRSHLVITDEKQKQVAQIQRDMLQDDKCCLMKIFSLSKERRLSARSGDDKSIFKILVPETLGKIGSMGKIAKFYSEIPRELDDCFGVELPDALGNPEKTLLLASIFILYRPGPNDC